MSLPQIIKRTVRATLPLLGLGAATQASAAVYGGDGLFTGAGLLAGVGGISSATSVTDLILKIIAFILDIVLIVAVLAVIVAGVYLIVSNGDDGSKDKAKKIIFYVVAGIILILFSRFLVVLINSVFS